MLYPIQEIYAELSEIGPEDLWLPRDDRPFVAATAQIERPSHGSDR